VTLRSREDARAGRTRSQGGEKLGDHVELAAYLHDRVDDAVEVIAGVGGADLAAEAGGALRHDGEAEAEPKSEGLTLAIFPRMSPLLDLTYEQPKSKVWP